MILSEKSATFRDHALASLQCTRILGCIGPFDYTGIVHIFHLAWAMCKPVVEILHRGEDSGRALEVSSARRTISAAAMGAARLSPFRLDLPLDRELV
jgi:hypothetical protein